MSVEKIPIRVQHKRMTAAEWRDSSLILLQGELGVESDTGYVKVGDGTNRFSALKYLTGPKGDRGEKGETGATGEPGRDGQVTFASLTQAQKNELKGDKGEQGIQGIPGANGTHSYTHIKYSNNANGSVMTDNSNSFYLGIYTGNSATAPSSPSSYKWSKIKGEQGDRGLQGIQGLPGRDGVKGERGLPGAKGDPGQNIINQQNQQPMKYWAGTQAQYNAIANKDNNTIYDVFE